ncbi:hypothetical protein IQ227_11990 [Anabaena aphanizomenioides LEGE 00250]|uniref:Uncharacterized protein n=1 Tax=Sphaerospermopsis aphanizomenoides LEGE 00250 TaxID=2777972 RepID=A0ABR9VE11_9CYAN|nr:hypothetical protein [Sphaerospermopsis aphanizomenoides]MBE9236726.1 hypothetical protein [Sphaerospermopsis aphanizomenoides LEGE 00250]
MLRPYDYYQFNDKIIFRMLRPYDYYQFNDKIIFRMLRPYDYYVLSGRSRSRAADDQLLI